MRGTRDNYHAEQEAKSAYSRTAPNQLVNAVVFLFYIILTVAIFVHTLIHVSKPSEGKKKICSEQHIEPDIRICLPGYESDILHLLILSLSFKESGQDLHK